MKKTEDNMKRRKKIFCIVALFALVLTLSGCGEKEENNNNDSKDGTVVTCTKTSEAATTGVDADLTYQYTEKDGYVQTLHTTEKLTSDNKTYLEAYQSVLEDSYEPYKNIEHYEYEITLKGNTLTSQVTIDYAKIDTDQLVAIDSSNIALIKDGKVAAADLKSLYESIGATCK